MLLKRKFIEIISMSLLSTLIAAYAVSVFFIGIPDLKTGLIYFGSMAVTAIVLGKVVLFYVDKLFIKPITLMIEGVEFVRTKKEAGACIKVDGHYQLEELANSINSMLEDLRNSQQELKESEKRFKHLSFTDTLTGLYNRAYFEYEMKRLNNNINAHLPLSIISVDIDGHKIVNDTFGHQAGDKQLKYVAEILKTSIRKEDTLARIGGDEFCIILPSVSYKLARKRREEIMEAVEEHNKRNPFIPLCISVGVAASEVKNKHESVYDVYHKADDNMYYRKFNKSAMTKNRVVDLFLSALAERDYVTQGHVERMVVLAEKMAEKLGLDNEKKDNLILLAKLHDMGNLGIPDDILFKPGELSPEERNKVKTHVNIGYNIASRSRELSHIADYILCHHEWWDGSGYPARIKGNKIPLLCRIISILDAYDTMTNPRLYKKVMDKENALQELRRCAGSQFDPVLVKEFIEIITDEDIKQGSV